LAEMGIEGFLAGADRVVLVGSSGVQVTRNHGRSRRQNYGTNQREMPALDPADQLVARSRGRARAAFRAWGVGYR
jgi:hypothetical protein